MQEDVSDVKTDRQIAGRRIDDGAKTRSAIEGLVESEGVVGDGAAGDGDPRRRVERGSRRPRVAQRRIAWNAARVVHEKTAAESGRECDGGREEDERKRAPRRRANCLARQRVVR